MDTAELLGAFLPCAPRDVRPRDALLARRVGQAEATSCGDCVANLLASAPHLLPDQSRREGAG